MFTMIRNSLILLLLFIILTGLIYPLVVTGLAQLIFPNQSNGSIIITNGKPVGSALIGQQFEDPKYFWGRLSATSPYPYNASSSSGSNLGTNNQALIKAVQTRVQALQEADPGNKEKIPVDLVTASGSGLDPNISLAAAQYQVKRVAQARHISETQVQELVMKHTQRRFLGFIGEPVVSVLQLNLDLDNLKKDE